MRLLSLAFHFCLPFKDGTEVANYLETPADQCIIFCFCPLISKKLGGEGVEVKRPYMSMATPGIAELHKG